MKRITLASSILAAASIFIFLTGFHEAPAEQPDIIKTTLPMWEMAKTHTLEVLDAMPEDKFGFKPAEESKTFASQMVHIAYSLHFFNERMIQGKQVSYQEPDAASMTKTEIRSMMEESFDEVIASVGQLTEEQLAATRPFGPNKSITVAQVILFAHDHTTNHRAKANLYIRMNDIQPPNYKFI